MSIFACVVIQYFSVVFNGFFRNWLGSEKCHKNEVLLYSWTAAWDSVCVEQCCSSYTWSASGSIHSFYTFISWCCCFWFFCSYILSIVPSLLLFGCPVICDSPQCVNISNAKPMIRVCICLAKRWQKQNWKKAAWKWWLICHVTYKNESACNIEVERQSEVIITSGKEWQSKNGTNGERAK